MLKKKNKAIKYIIIFLLIAVTLLSISLFLYFSRDKATPNKANVQQNNAYVSENKQTYSKSDKESLPMIDQTNNSSNKKILAIPRLLKSSGNNGPVPENALINFICQGQDGLDCFIELQDTSNPNNKLILAKKPILSERSQGFASWDWTSVLGKWNIKAIIIDKEGNTSASEPQNLEVIR